MLKTLCLLTAVCLVFLLSNGLMNHKTQAPPVKEVATKTTKEKFDETDTSRDSSQAGSTEVTNTTPANDLSTEVIGTEEKEGEAVDREALIDEEIRKNLAFDAFEEEAGEPASGKIAQSSSSTNKRRYNDEEAWDITSQLHNNLESIDQLLNN